MWERLQFDTVETTVASTGTTTEAALAAAAGNLLVSALTVDKDAGGVPAPSEGWTPITGDQGTSVSVAMAYRIADGTAADACAWTWPSSRTSSASIAEFDLEGATVKLVDSGTNFTDESSVASVALSATGGEFAVGMVGIDTGGNWDTATWEVGLKEGQYVFGVSEEHVGPGLLFGNAVSASNPFEATGISGSGGDQASGIVATFSIEEEEEEGDGSPPVGTLGMMGVGR